MLTIAGPMKVAAGSKQMEMKYLAGHIFDFSTKQVNQQTLVACKELGIRPSDLLEKNIDYFRSISTHKVGDDTVVTDDIAKLRMANYEQRRRNKMRFIVEYFNSSRQTERKSPPGGNSLTPQMNKRNTEFFQTELQKDSQRFEQLKRVQQNMEQNALDELKKMDTIKKHIQKKEQKANKQKLQTKSEREQNKQDNNHRLREAIQRRTAIEKENEQQSMLDFEKNLAEIQARKEKKSQHDRLLSAQFYSSLRMRHGSQESGKENQELLIPDDVKEPKQLGDSFKVRATSSFVVGHKDNTLFENSGRHGKSTVESNNIAHQPTIKSARRPQTSKPTLLRKPTCQQEYETDFALDKFNNRMLAAMKRLSESSQIRNRQVNNETKKRDEILQRRRELHQMNELASLQNYVLHNRTIQKSQRKQREMTMEVKQQLQKDLMAKSQMIENHKKQIINDHQSKVQMIEAKIMEKDSGAQQARQSMYASSRFKRELRELQHLEVAEKRFLSKQLQFVEKRQLIQKQEQIRDNYNDLQMLQHNLQQMRIANDQRRLELVSQRSQQVKLAKDNYLNQCEQEEKKKKAKLLGEV